MTTVVIASPFGEESIKRLKAAGDGRCVLETLDRGATPEKCAELMEKADAIIGYAPPELIKRAGRLRWFQATWAGMDIFSGGIPAGAVVTNTSGAFGPVIAEHIIACLLALCRRIPAYVRQSGWKKQGSELSVEGGRVLILGAGDIGRRTAERLRPFGPRLVGVRRVKRAVPPCFDEMYTLDELDSQLAAADFVVCCLPGTDETRGLLDARRLGLMKESAILVNVGRGSLIDTAALEAALAAGRLFGAALDVTEPEPLPKESPLWAMDNVIITPHVAGIGFGHLPATERRITDICCENLRRWLEGRELENVVDMALGYRRTVM